MPTIDRRARTNPVPTNSTQDGCTYLIVEQRRLRQACVYAQSGQSLRFSNSITQSMVADNGSDQ